MAVDPGFRALTVKISGRAKQLITNLEVSAAFDPNEPPNPQPAKESTNALWDTGASKSVISRAVVKKLGLTPTGATNVSHAGEMSVSPTHLVNFYLPNKVGMLGILVTEFEGTGDFGAIVGMDVIAIGDFSVTNMDEQTWMSFRTPSMVSIDYVQEHTKEMFSGTGRNDPCPCGSGQKFKKCHRVNP